MDSYDMWKFSDFERRLLDIEVKLGLREPPAEAAPVVPPSEDELQAAHAVIARAGQTVHGK